MNWFNKTRFIVPSYRRSDTICQRTLPLLDRLKVPPQQVTIYVANELEFTDYQMALPAKWSPCLKVGIIGVNAVRNLAIRSVPVGTPLVFFDDDIRKILVRNPKMTSKMPRRDQCWEASPEEFRKLVNMGFDLCQSEGLRVWGVYPVNNPLFMKDRVFIGLSYIIAAFFGIFAHREKDLMTQHGVKEDHERTLRHYHRDGAVIRIEHHAVDTSYFGGHGGLHADGLEARHKRANAVIEKLVAEFPMYCKVWEKKDYRDIKLHRLPRH